MQSYDIGLRAKPLANSNTWLVAGSLCLCVLTLLPFVFYRTSSALVSAWNNATAYNYCFLVLPISAYLAWERRDSLFAARPRPSLVGLGVLIAAGAIWVLGQLSGAVIVSELALIAMAQSTVVAILGMRATRAIAFPILYLIFLLPVGESLIPPLQTVTADSAVALLKITGLPVRSDGLMIYVANTAWLVAEACAGVKFLIASVALGALLSGMFLRSWRRRIVFMGLSVVVPILANGFRAYLIILIGYLTNQKYAVGADHILYGWVLFALVLAGMTGIAVAMRDETDQTEERNESLTRSSGASTHSFASAALCCLILVLSFQAGASALAIPPANISVPTGLPLTVQRPWKVIDAKDPAPPIFPGADRVWHQAYSDGARTIYLTLGYFAAERPGAEVASSSHRFISGAPTLQTGEHWQDASIAQRSLSVRALTFGAKQDRRLVWYWLWVDGSYTGNPYLAKLMQLKVKLLGGPPAAAIISISADYTGGEDSTAAVLARFVRSLGTIDSPS